MHETGLPPASDDTITFKRSHLYAVLLPLAFVLGLSVGYLFWGREGRQTAAAQPPPAQSAADASPTTAEGQVRRYDVPADDDPALGPQDAAVTVIEFSDYECPYCSKWHSEVFARLMETYPQQVRFVYRDFPLTSIHPNAQPAAVAANCANEQGAFWEFHEKLFSGQPLGAEAYQRYAQDIGLNLESFNVCLEKGNYAAEVQADFEYAANLGIRSTPTFFINGIPLVGAQPFEVFQEVIEKELAGEIP